MKSLTKLLKLKYFWIAVYVLCLGLSFWYVNSILKKGALNVSGTQETKKTVEIKPAKVSLVVEMPKATLRYETKKTNTDSVLDLLNTLRKTTDFRYQKTGYIDRNELDFVNGMYPPLGFKWKIFSNGQDITQSFQDTYLVDDASYTIKLIKE